MDKNDILRHIVDSPEDMSLRLILADWLDERGDPLCGLIREQHRLSQLSGDDLRRVPHELRVRDLVTQHHDQWIKPLLNLGAKVSLESFRCGFVEQISLTGSNFQQRYEALFRAAPLLSQVHVLMLSAMSLSDLLSSKGAAQLRGLSLEGNRLTVKGARTLAASTHLSGLRLLNVRGTGLRQMAAEALANSENLVDLEELLIGNNQIGPRGASAISRSKHWRKLKSLDLSATGIQRDGLSSLAKGQATQELERLELRELGLSEDDAGALGQLAELPDLQDLVLDDHVAEMLFERFGERVALPCT